jgi:hypothetical protein
MVSSGINYRETYLEFPELTKLQGKPNAESLYKLRNELKANAQAVTSSLSDGAHGHLALVLSVTQYALLTNQPFVRPVHPGPLTIATAASNALTTVKKGSQRSSPPLPRSTRHRESSHPANCSGHRGSLPFFHSQPDQQLSLGNCPPNP